MEVFLLLLDEIDDAVAIARALLPRVLGLVIALSLLFATGFVVLMFPQVALPAIAVLLSATLFERMRYRRLGTSAPAERHDS